MVMNPMVESESAKKIHYFKQIQEYWVAIYTIIPIMTTATSPTPPNQPTNQLRWVGS